MQKVCTLCYLRKSARKYGCKQKCNRFEWSGLGHSAAPIENRKKEKIKKKKKILVTPWSSCSIQNQLRVI